MIENNGDRMGFGIIAIAVVGVVLAIVIVVMPEIVQSFFDSFKTWIENTFKGAAGTGAVIDGLHSIIG